MNRKFEIKNLFSALHKKSVRAAFLSILLALTISTLVWKTGAVSVNAAPEGPPLGSVRCPSEYTLASLSGCYGWRSNESRISSSSGFVPTVAVGLMSFDGAGNLTGAYTGNINGLPVKRTYTGIYTMNPNGTGILRFVDNTGFSNDYEFVMVEGINEIFLIHTLQGIQQTLVMKKQ